MSKAAKRQKQVARRNAKRIVNELRNRNVTDSEESEEEYLNFTPDINQASAKNPCASYLINENYIQKNISQVPPDGSDVDIDLVEDFSDFFSSFFSSFLMGLLSSFFGVVLLRGEAVLGFPVGGPGLKNFRMS